MKPVLAHFVLACVLMAGADATVWIVLSGNLPYIGSLREYNPPTIREVCSEEGEVIGRFWEEKVVPFRSATFLLTAFSIQASAVMAGLPAGNAPSVWAG